VEESINFLINEIIDIQGDNIGKEKTDSIRLKKEVHVQSSVRKQEKNKCC
jgi:hypothetical protein